MNWIKRTLGHLGKVARAGYHIVKKGVLGGWNHIVKPVIRGASRVAGVLGDAVGSIANAPLVQQYVSPELVQTIEQGLNRASQFGQDVIQTAETVGGAVDDVARRLGVGDDPNP